MDGIESALHLSWTLMSDLSLWVMMLAMIMAMHSPVLMTNLLDI